MAIEYKEENLPIVGKVIKYKRNVYTCYCFYDKNGIGKVVGYIEPNGKKEIVIKDCIDNKEYRFSVVDLLEWKILTGNALCWNLFEEVKGELIKQNKKIEELEKLVMKINKKKWFFGG